MHAASFRKSAQSAPKDSEATRTCGVAPCYHALCVVLVLHTIGLTIYHMQSSVVEGVSTIGHRVDAGLRRLQSVA
jgi:hypothetical protein